MQYRAVLPTSSTKTSPRPITVERSAWQPDFASAYGALGSLRAAAAYHFGQGYVESRAT